MPPTPSQPGSPEAPAIAEAPHISLIGLARNKAALVAGISATIFTGGLVARVAIANSTTEGQSLTQANSFLDNAAVVPSTLSDFKAVKANTTITQTSQKDVIAKIAQWSKECPKSLTVNPTSLKEKYRHDRGKNLGRLDYIEGKKPTIKYAKKIGAKVCGGFGLTKAEFNKDGTVKKKSKYIIVKPYKKWTYSPKGLDSFSLRIKPSNE